VVFVAAAVIVWRVGFHTPQGSMPLAEPTAGAATSAVAGAGPNEPASEGTGPPPDANAPSNATVAGDPNGPPAAAEPNQAVASGRPQVDSSAEPNETRSQPTEPNAPAEPNEPLEAVNLKDVEMKNVIDKIATWTGKTVIPTDEVMKQKITIYAPQKLPRIRALSTIYSALRMKGFVAEEVDDTIFLKPIKEAKLGVVPTVSVDEPLALFENKDQVVRKMFKLNNYAPAQMSEVVQPLVGEYGYVGADETTGTLMVIDTVANLMSIEHIIAQFDVPEAGKTVEEFFEIKYGDPAEIIQLLRMLLGEAPRGGSRARNVARPVRSTARSGAQSNASSIVISAGEIPLVLIPVPKLKWIIARGSAQDVKQIHDWVEKLDREDPVRSEYETVSIKYANAREVAMRIEDALSNLPGAEGLRPSIMVRPLEQSRQIMVIGRADLRDMVKGLIAEIDMPAGTFETKVFDLKHADPEEIKTNVESLYGENIPGASYSSSAIYYYYQYGAGRNAGGADTVKVIAFPMMKQVTIIASPENMRKIEKQVEEWDTPLDVEAVKPRIIELRNSDPVQMVQLLTKLFSDSQDSSSNILNLLLYGEMGDQRKKIVGPLYGQLTFEDVPGTKKIIVISKVPAAYAVIEQLIYELDRQQMAEVPHVVQLKYADPEDLSERLNAMFNEPGTTARIRRSAQGLREYSMDGGSQDNQRSSPNGSNAANDREGGTANDYTTWWSAGARARPDEKPISNVIGRVRFIPDPRSKSILVLAPPEFQDDIEQTIRQLDTPGKQMLIKAIIVEVDHSSMTSLGIQLATDPAAFGSLSENAALALGQLTNLATRGSAVAGDSPLGAVGSGTIAGGTASVYGLIDFLIKTTNAKVLNQQTLWTEDNEEAMFFKGQTVGFLGASTVTTSASQQSLRFEDVGMVLQVRPSITPERQVDMEVRLQLSQLTTELVNSQPIRDKMETSTNMIVQDGETIMLGGMLFQRDSLIKRKLPLLGDLPLLGGLFRHKHLMESNSELIVFVTPYVIDEGTTSMSARAREQLDSGQEMLDHVQGQLEATSERLRQKIDKE
jgi:general secretion pathway protein D